MLGLTSVADVAGGARTDVTSDTSSGISDDRRC